MVLRKSLSLEFDDATLPQLIGVEPISVSDLANAIKKTIEISFDTVRVRGELSGVLRHFSGHLYFSLKDATALIDGICWKTTKLNFDVENGMEVGLNIK
jgi:exodeoxyribonuclease VII large subunit